MEHPPAEIASSERLLTGEKITELQCTQMVRQIAAHHEGLLMESEEVSYDNKFGYIYRYNIVEFAVDDGSIYPDAGTKGRTYKIESKLVLHTHDCKSVEGEYYSGTGRRVKVDEKSNCP